jgi:hypothetical protein
MALDAITETPRPWQDVAKEQAYSLRYLGEKVGRQHTTMLAYSIGKRRTPREILDRMSELFGEPVR